MVLEMFKPISAYEYPSDLILKKLYQVQISGGDLREPGYNIFVSIGQYGRDTKAKMNTKERNNYIKIAKPKAGQVGWQVTSLPLRMGIWKTRSMFSWAS